MRGSDILRGASTHIILSYQMYIIKCQSKKKFRLSYKLVLLNVYD